MKLLINNTTFTKLDSISFAPEADLINDSLPIPEFECRVYTNARINYGQWAELLDNNNRLYARYWLRFAERVGRDEDNDTYIVRLIGQSPLAFLERVTMPAEMVDDDAETLIMGILDYLGTMGQSGDIISDAYIDSAVGDVTVTGFCPEQTARERLQWILSAAGGYALSAFNDVIEIHQVPFGRVAMTTIPMEVTFWKPSITYRDYVTKIKVSGYTYTKRTPTSTEEYVTDGTDYWVLQKQVITLSNPNLPSGVPNNEVEVDGVTVLSPARASVVATILANHYFNRIETDAEIINNCEYMPGDAVRLYTDKDSMVSGYIDSCNFTFAAGLNNKSSIHLIGTTSVETAKLTVQYTYDSTVIKKRKYTLPKGIAYAFPTEYVDHSMNDHRYIFRPTIAEVSGTLNSNTTETVPLAVAIDHYTSDVTDRTDIENLMKDVVEIIDRINETESSAIEKAYKKNKTKREKYLKKIAEKGAKQMEAWQKAKKKMLKGIPSEAGILYVVSVDDVGIEGQVISDGNTVVIDGGEE